MLPSQCPQYVHWIATKCPDALLVTKTRIYRTLTSKRPRIKASKSKAQLLDFTGGFLLGRIRYIHVHVYYVRVRKNWYPVKLLKIYQRLQENATW